MDIKLNRLELENFKNLTGMYEFGPSKNVVSGRNKVGKTTLFDAMLWLLFDKDSSGRSKFEIKTIKGGKVQHHLTHSVHGVFLIGDDVIEFKKTFLEKWTKKRGSRKESFTGHETKYEIDGVPCDKAEYLVKVSSIIDSETFRLLTDPHYFPSLPWKKCRAMLQQLINVDESKIAESVGLTEFLGGKSVEDARKIQAAKRKKINGELEEIPARIDELQAQIDVAVEPGEDIPNLVQAENDVKIAKDNISEVSNNVGRKEAKEIAILQNELNEVNSQHDAELRRNKNSLEDSQSALRKVKNAISDQTDVSMGLDKQLSDLRERFVGRRDDEFTYDDKCDKCGQNIPEEMREEAEKHFNSVKADELESINATGKELKDKVKSVDKLLNSLKAQEVKTTQALDDCDVVVKPPPRIAELEGEISALQSAVPDVVVPEKMKQELEEAESVLRTVQTGEAGKQATKSMQKRVKELKSKMKDLSKEYDEVEKIISLIEDYDVKLAAETENQLNSMFNIVNFRMFREQINEGIQETCDILVDGVPYNAGLNKGTQINAGLDIISVFSKFMDTWAPVFIDNAESVSNIFPLDCQTFELYVGEEKTLTQKLV
jgi:chromosome segregation ATPase